MGNINLQDFSKGLTQKVDPSNSNYWKVNPEAPSNYAKLGANLRKTNEVKLPGQTVTPTNNTQQNIPTLNTPTPTFNSIRMMKNGTVRQADNQEQAQNLASLGFNILTSDIAKLNNTKLKEQLDSISSSYQQEQINKEKQNILNSGLSATEQNITNSANKQERLLKEQFTQERGTENATQFRLGVAGTPYDQEQDKRYERSRTTLLQELDNAKQDALIAARNAYGSKSMDLAQEKLNQYNDLADKQRAIRSSDLQYKANEFALLQKQKTEKRAQTTFANQLNDYQLKIDDYNRAKAQNDISNLIGGGVDLSQISEDKKREYEQTLGMPVNSFDGMYSNFQEVDDLNKSGDKISLASKILELQNKMPIGSKMSLNGLEIVGTNQGVSNNLDDVEQMLKIEKLQNEIDNSTDAIDKELAITKLNSEISKLDSSNKAKENQLGYQTNKADNLIDTITDALPLVSGTTTGWGTMLKYIPGTKATTLRSYIDTITAGLSFKELQDMRDASPTGGALGQVSERELELLGSALSSLRQSQEPAIVRENLTKIQTHYIKWKDNLLKAEKQKEDNLINTNVNSSEDAFAEL